MQQEVTHGNAIGIYFFDPEGNRNEVYLRIERDVRQPFRKTVNLDQDPEGVPQPRPHAPTCSAPVRAWRAKAISLDDESLRTLQLAGSDEAVYPIIVPGTGTKYFGARGQVLVHARGPGGYRFGHPFKNAFAQPDLEQVLRDE